MTEFDDLVARIAQHLEIDHQYLERVEAWDTERIAEVRSAGRKAGRVLGWKIITRATSPDDENRVLVVVVIRDWPDNDERERAYERSALLMNDFWTSLMGKNDADPEA